MRDPATKLCIESLRRDGIQKWSRVYMSDRQREVLLRKENCHLDAVFPFFFVGVALDRELEGQRDL